MKLDVLCSASKMAKAANLISSIVGVRCTFNHLEKLIKIENTLSIQINNCSKY